MARNRWDGNARPSVLLLLLGHESKPLREAQWGPLNEDGLRACCIIALWLHLIAVLIASETQEL